MTWLEIYDKSHIDLPYDLDQIPDAIISIYKGGEGHEVCVGFRRVSGASLLQKGVDSDPRWFELNHDTSYNFKGDPHGYPGSVLMRIVFANSDDVTTLQDWDSLRKKLTVKKAYIVKIHIYQIRGLPSIDENGLMDPYCRVRFNGKKHKTKIQLATRNPVRL